MLKRFVIHQNTFDLWVLSKSTSYRENKKIWNQAGNQIFVKKQKGQNENFPFYPLCQPTGTKFELFIVKAIMLFNCCIILNDTTVKIIKILFQIIFILQYRHLKKMGLDEETFFYNLK